jgi:GNAT superfamily N-acetyltransferase
MSQTIWEKDGFYISTEKQHLDLDVIFNYLSKVSYWAKERPRDIIDKSIENSALCFGIYIGNPKDGVSEQIGFARVVSDLATFAYLADVFILEPYRGQGLSKWLLANITGHPELSGLRRFMLATNDAHTLYSQFGFKPLNHVERFMELIRTEDY